MNMEAMTILNPNEQTNIERKFDALADNVFSESTPVRQLPFHNVTDSGYRAYDSNLKEEEIFKKFGMNISENNDSDNSIKDMSVHETPSNTKQEDVMISENDINPIKQALAELETASMSKHLDNGSSVKISRPSEDVVISNTKIQSKDNAWKPAPVMNMQPQIVNNLQSYSNSQNYSFRTPGFSQSIRVPKHTLGQENTSYNMQTNHKASVNDSIETFAPEPQPHPSVGDSSFQYHKVNTLPNFHVVKENVSLVKFLS